MNVAGWIYDRAPERVRNWMDARTFQKEADHRYEQHLQRKGNGTKTALQVPFGPEKPNPDRGQQQKAQTQQYWNHFAEIGRQAMAQSRRPEQRREEGKIRDQEKNRGMAQ